MKYVPRSCLKCALRSRIAEYLFTNNALFDILCPMMHGCRYLDTIQYPAGEACVPLRRSNG